jgi:uncharacterized membrane protein YgdD (TMEM256/DUF423 family)
VRCFLRAGAIGALLGVVAGAFGSHVLSQRLDAHLMAAFQTATTYQMYHSLALLVLGAMHHQDARSALWLRRAGVCFMAGMLLFCGSLYALSLGAAHVVGAITPLGGVLFLAGWLSLIRGAWARE